MIKSSIKKILIVSFSNIGDAVLSVPVLENLRRRFPDAHIDVLAGPRAQGVFDGDPRVSRLLVRERPKGIAGYWKYFLELRRERYDLVVDLRHKGLFHRPFKGHKRDEHLAVLKSLGLDARNEIGQLAVGTVPRPSSLVPRPFVVIAPASRSHIKQWPKERFAALASRLADKGAGIAWIGDASEKPLVDEIAGLAGCPSENFAGRLSWKESAALIRGADLLVTNDSAPLHAADHMGRKVLAFFGPTDPAKYGPQRTPEGVLFRGKFCSPCEEARCRYNLECMNEISVDEAYKRAIKLLAGSRVSELAGESVKETSFNPLTRKPVNPQTPKFLLVRLDRLGDLLLSFPAFNAVRRAYPDARVTVLTRPYTRAAAERSPDVDDALDYDYRKGGAHASIRGWWRLVREIRRRRYDAAFILHPTLRSHLLCFMAGISVRIGYRARGAVLLTRAVEDKRHEGRQHESEYVMDIVNAYLKGQGARGKGQGKSSGISHQSSALKFEADDSRLTTDDQLHHSPFTIHPKFDVFPEDKRAAERLLAAAGLAPGERYIVLHPASNSPSKQWPAERFIELAHLAAGEWKCRIVLVGEPLHAETSARIAAASGAADLTGKTDIAVLAAVLKGAFLVIANDSGPAHLAALTGSAVVSIFGRKEPGLSAARWRPLGRHSAVVQKDVGCVVCLADECPIGFECLKALQPIEVLEKARGLLGQRVGGLTG